MLGEQFDDLERFFQRRRGIYAFRSVLGHVYPLRCGGAATTSVGAGITAAGVAGKSGRWQSVLPMPYRAIEETEEVTP